MSTPMSLNIPTKSGTVRPLPRACSSIAATAVAMCQWLVNVRNPGSAEAVVSRKLASFRQRILRRSVHRDVEDAHPLLGGRGRVEPGGEGASADLGLADAESRAVVEPAMPPAVPGALEVLGQVARREELVWRRETGDCAVARLRRDRPPPDGEGAVGSLGGPFMPRVAVRVHPGESSPVRRGGRQPGVVEIRPILLQSAHDGLDVDQPRLRVQADVQFPGERPGRQPLQGDRHAMTVACHAHALQVQLRPMRLVGTLRRGVEKLIEGAHPRRAVGRRQARPDGHEERRIDRLQDGHVPDPEALDERHARPEVEHQAPVLPLRHPPAQHEPVPLVAGDHPLDLPVSREIDRDTIGTDRKACIGEGSDEGEFPGPAQHFRPQFGERPRCSATRRLRSRYNPTRAIVRANSSFKLGGCPRLPFGVVLVACPPVPCRGPQHWRKSHQSHPAEG